MPKRGYKQTKEHVEKGRLARIGRVGIKRFGKDNSFYGKHHSQKTKDRIREKAQNRRHSKETKKKISRSLAGNKNPNFGRRFSRKHCERISKTKIRNKSHSGKRNGNWCGGISKLPYNFEFNNELKDFIRQRDDYTCQFCGVEENSRAFVPHHIDYNKKNSNELNLILLCNSCNIKANFQREKWQFLFEILQEIRL